MKKSVKNIIPTILTYSFLIIMLLLTIYPILYVFFSSFKTNQEILTSGTRLLPQKFSLENFKQAWGLANFKQYTWNSTYMTFFIIVGTLVNSTMGGYVFARGRFPGKNILFALFTGTMFISLGSITLFPLMDIAKVFHLNNSIWGVIIIKVFGLHVTNVYLVKSFIESIPGEIDEAAKIDGCSFFGIFYHIIAPLLKPVIATVGLLTFRAAWNDYLMPMVFTLGNTKQTPLVVGVVALKNSSDAATSWNLMLAGTMLSLIPILATYLFLNRYFISGLTSGSVKG